MQVKRHFFTVMLAIGVVFPTTAQACRAWVFQTPMLHQTVPVLPEGVVAVEVEITSIVRTADEPFVEARIISMIAGDFVGTKLRFGPRAVSSCDSYPAPGERGIAVGYVRSTSDGVLVIDPIRAPSYAQLQRQVGHQAEGASKP